MTSTITQYIYPSQLTPVKAASDTNYAATYYNGPSDNGVGATLTTSGIAYLDGVSLNVGDRVIFWKQTNAWENGIYVVTVAGGSSSVYTRSDDFQSIEQIKPGYNVSVMNGSTYAGMVLTTKGPQIQFVGVDSVVFISASDVGPYRTFLNDELKIEHDVTSVHTTFHMADSVVGNSTFNLDCQGTSRTLTMGGNITAGAAITTTGAFVTNQATTINTFGATLVNTAAYSNALSALNILYTVTAPANFSSASVVIPFPGVTANSVVVANLSNPSTSEHIIRIVPAANQITFYFPAAPGADSSLSIIVIAVP